MGIVLSQSIRNTLILILGFTIGGINTILLYTKFLSDEYYGLIIFLLSTSVLLLPLLVFGMQHSVVKYFSSYKTKQDQDSLLTWSLIIPLLVIIPLGIFGGLAYETIAKFLSVKNELIKDYTYLIFFTAIFMGYFEVFYSWAKVQMNSVFGSFIKEIFVRIGVTVLLFCVYFKWLNPEEFIYGVVSLYFARMLVMLVYALSIYRPTLTFTKPKNFVEILRYSMYLILAGSAGSILLEIDKFMIPQVEELANLAFYGVAVFIASTVAIPNRAMQQITNPITAKDLNENELRKVKTLYKQSSINLLVVGGLLFLLINLNINDIYKIIGEGQYAIAISVVLIISCSELYKLALGTNGAILTNSKYYRMFFYFSLGMAGTVIVLNHFLIRLLGINGAAWATLMTVVVFSTIKVLYLKRKLKMQPFAKETIYIIAVITAIFGIFYFVDFPFISIVNIGLKSAVVILLYVIIVYKLRISKDVNELINQVIKK
ncbi:lipopolysaccharide biosynthesis protein [Urechidicola vernalis]|uniref:Oligosaccharide flippase family protein n=1 Tax=Urechidicola vernalis TaxID=3075600 RepID=A0ABU2YB79_9FLAO|nr:oligosaccharide flippase family protein [Urechidicola sp. P050]MDT0554308.1 oligosaccharide flippase family protein [Urechidicola sp. P050]